MNHALRYHSSELVSGADVAGVASPENSRWVTIKTLQKETAFGFGIHPGMMQDPGMIQHGDIKNEKTKAAMRSTTVERETNQVRFFFYLNE